MESVFAKYEPVAYPYQFNTELLITKIAGGIPSDPNVMEGWIKAKLGADKDDLLRAQVAEVMVERGITADEAAQVVNANRYLNGFKRLPDGTLYIEGRIVKSMLREASNIRWPKDRWGPTRKGTISYWAEHVFCQDDIIPLGVKEPTDVNQRFVHTWRGSGIQYEEYVENAKVSFVVATDINFTEEQWGMMWVTAQHNGLGASRSQGFGKFIVTKWEPVTALIGKPMPKSKLKMKVDL